MRREEAIAIIKAHAGRIQSFGAAALYLFGSTSRDEALQDSDVDIFIDRDPARHVGYVQLTDLEFYLEELLKTEVDLTTRTALHPSLRADIERSAIRVI